MSSVNGKGGAEGEEGIAAGPAWLHKTGDEEGGSEIKEGFEPPSWLNDDNVDAEAGADGLGSSVAQKTGPLGTLMETPPAPDDDGAGADFGGNKSRRRRCCSGMTCYFAFSTVLFATFVYSSFVQDNDPDGTGWTAYYALSAIIPVAFLIRHFCTLGLLERAIYALSATMAIWSVVNLVLISSDLKSYNEQGEEEYGLNGVMGEELALDLAGVLIGLVSALYHAVSTWCLVRRRRNGTLDADDD